MKVTKKLVMSFMTFIGREVSICIDDPREDLSEQEIKDAMDVIVSKNVFAPYGSDIVEAVDAKIVVTDTTNFDLEV